MLNNKKIRSLVIMLVVAICISMTGCGQGSGNGNTSVSTSQDSTSGSSTTAQNNTGNSSPDLTKKISINLMTPAWVGTPRPADDPYQKWINEKFNVDFIMDAIPYKDFETQLMVRLSSGEQPDIIHTWDQFLPKMQALYDQGVFIEDWNQYINNMPAVKDNISEAGFKKLSKDGKLMFITKKTGPSTAGWQIRTDWLKNLGLEVPKTVEELLNVAKAFTFNDPDKNGKNDTYAFTSAGGGSGIGEIINLMNMYGPQGFYVDGNGKVTHRVVDGNYEKYLNFLKQVVSDKLIDPDFITVQWAQRAPNVYNSKYGKIGRASCRERV